MKHRILKTLMVIASLMTAFTAQAIDHPSATRPMVSNDRFTLISDGKPVPVIFSQDDDKAVLHAAADLLEDFERVSGVKPVTGEKLEAEHAIIIGSLASPIIKEMVSRGRFNVNELEGCIEKYLISTVEDPVEGVGEALVIAGSDRRGTVYGIYELSEQIGVSPWYDWLMSL